MQFEEAKRFLSEECKTCTLCEKPIEAAKFKLHDVMCHRMNYKCQTCGSVANKKEVHVCEVPQPIQEHQPEVVQEMKVDEPEPMAEQSQKEMEEASLQMIRRMLQEDADVMDAQLA